MTYNRTADFGKWHVGEDVNVIRIPPLPKYIALTDRGNGTVWYLQHSFAVPSVDGLGYISITDQQPFSLTDWVVYGPYDGPVIGSDGIQPNCKLLVRNGTLGFEPFSQDVISSGPIFTRRKVAQETRLIYRPKSFPAVQTLAWTPVSVS